MSPALLATTTGGEAVSTQAVDLATTQKLTQVSLDNTASLLLWLAVLLLVVLVIIAIHVPFIARLYASVAPLLHSPSSNLHTHLQKASFSEAARRHRVVGGGGLFTGWILRSSPKHLAQAHQHSSALSRPSRPLGPCSTQPSPTFSSDFYPFNGDSDKEHTRYPSKPELPIAHPQFTPPPREGSLLSYIPNAQYRYLAPFTLLPSHFGTSLNLAGIAAILLYLVVLLLCMVYRSDVGGTMKGKGYGNDFARTGLLGAAQIPLVFLLGCKNSPLGLVLGRGYEKLKVFHKVVGRTAFLCATLHVGFFLHKWAKANALGKELSQKFILFGLLGWLAQILIVISSLPWVRKHWFGVFEVSHMIGMIGLLVGLGFHVDQAKPYCIAGASIYLTSLFVSLIKTRYTIATFVPHPQSGFTHINIPSIGSGWRAGQHVRIRIPSLPYPHNLESHPFSIASAPHTDGLELIIKALPGGWTAHLLQAAFGEDQRFSLVDGYDTARTAPVIIEGPYGGYGNTLLESYTSLLLISGGSGISHVLGVARNLIHKAPTGVVRPRTLDLIWVVKTEKEARHLLPQLFDLVNLAKDQEETSIEGRRRGKDLAPPVALRVEVHLSRTLHLDHSRSSLLDQLDLRPKLSEADKEKEAYLQQNGSIRTDPSTTQPYKFNPRSVPLSNFQILPRRPQLDTVIDRVVAETADRIMRHRAPKCGIAVVVCGPERMVNTVRNGVVGLSSWRHEEVGGVDFVEQPFGF
ncbi:hypothetical protein TREMEDRAFT_74287 [Tremella mesenterica DSM 1558]|uniref:uncharacterized protein n=1 Tax=Tremella mesenterica (strain ATCC 24925 / CBS 8224 / DSM 1558 / NBRC 9311 / NRRL Y-6157 / RJB 2259-6 / UBC 559-6) TaxID=578456 RepID=UPI0003F49273|nr:uncharacterized protein TREMEDRAFT_74287 [Tremella mesenterica DSM 1558]EIW68440.1 hypothetical protein TREMEDRAFT_74287 [Tremella mesenterica DSM 1558]